MSVKRVDHVGILVRDLEVAQRFVTEVLGFECLDAFDTGERGTKVGYYRAGDAVLELIEPTTDQARRDRLGDAPAVVDHIALEVGDVEELTARLGDVIWKQVMANRPSALGRVRQNAFSERDESAGISFQFLEFEA